MGKSLIVLGLLLVGVGLVMTYGGKLPMVGKLPGDIHIEKEDFSFYFPLGTCLVVSVLASFLFWLFRR